MLSTKICKIIPILLFGFTNSLFADNNDSIPKKAKTGIMPIAFYTPETRLGFGGIMYSYFKTSNNDTITKKSNTQTYFDFTLNKQVLFQTDYSIFSKKNKFYFKGQFDYLHFPEYYYGIGNNTKSDQRCLIDFNLVNIATDIHAKLKKNTYLGLLLHHQSLYMLDKSLVNLYNEREVIGGSGYASSGIGVGYLMDKRNNQLNPEKGHYLEIKYLTFFNHSKTSKDFNSLTIDARGYKTFFKKLVWNINAFASFNKGEVPFRMMPYIGGPRFLRGYYQGRFRDNNLIVLQHEFRYHLFWRIGIAAFSGIGQVAKDISDFKVDDFHYNYGLGIRFKLDRKENTNLRIDIGKTKDSYGIYVVFAEAF